MGMWSSTEDFVKTADLGKGDSLGRDSRSTNMHSFLDWAFPGGVDANGATLSARNEVQVVAVMCLVVVVGPDPL